MVEHSPKILALEEKATSSQTAAVFTILPFDPVKLQQSLLSYPSILLNCSSLYYLTLRSY